MYAIEYLDAHGFWRALEQSSIETGFKMRPHPTFATRAEAEAHIVELQSAGTWRGLRVSPACTGEFVGQDGELLSPEAPITTDVAGDQWCAGHYDGNSTWEPLGSDYSACDCECCTVDPCTGPGHAAGCIHQ